ncbi:MAG: DUF547 domain-containing protein [Planctomycetota bacterium]|jgi:hypothetical protein
MATPKKTAISLKLLFIAAILTAAHPSAPAPAKSEQPAFEYDNYAQTLKAFVDNRGMVNYHNLRDSRAKLDVFALQMKNLDPEKFQTWSENQKIAFWVNAYNALTIKAIIDNYPIKASFFKSRIYPKNSIRQIPGVWTKLKFEIMQKDLTLNHIEHKILRKQFDEPRIHMALVCAAISCPPLRNEPYAAEKLDAQLKDQTDKFLADPAKFKIDRKKNKVHLSPILKWFAEDFLSKYTPRTPIPGKKKSTSATLNFIAQYSDQATAEYLRSGKYKVQYLKYDWSLNEKKEK